MVCDYLGFQSSVTASERVFSSASLTATLQHNQLSPEMFKALPSLKNAYRNGHIGASEEGHNRVIDFLDVFDGDLGYTDEVSGGWEWFDYFLWTFTSRFVHAVAMRKKLI
jgi:hypothetical protein